jgi:hypothetical protein
VSRRICAGGGRIHPEMARGPLFILFGSKLLCVDNGASAELE